MLLIFILFFFFCIFFPIISLFLPGPRSWLDKPLKTLTYYSTFFRFLISFFFARIGGKTKGIAFNYDWG